MVYQSAIGDGKEKENTNIKIHSQVHYTVALQFYVHVNVESYVHAFLKN